MEKPGFFVEIKEMMDDYVENQVLLLKLQATEKAAKLSSSLFLVLIITFFSLVIFMIISFIAGYYLSQLVHSYPGGFAILGALYIILMYLIISVHKKFTSKKIEDQVVKFAFENKER